MNKRQYCKMSISYTIHLISMLHKSSDNSLYCQRYCNQTSDHNRVLLAKLITTVYFPEERMFLQNYSLLQIKDKIS